ncbi:MAG: hypothetical protein JSW26_03600, partial [Desulfobacterales bacterium]
SLSPAGSQNSSIPKFVSYRRYFSFAVVSRQRKRINALWVLCASSAAGGEIILLQYSSAIEPNMSKKFRTY